MSEEMLTVREVAIRFEVSTTTVYDWIKKGELDCVTIGKIAKRKFIPVSSVERFEASRSSNTDSDSGRESPYVAAA
jgi:excisionase family DNA binding protein